MDSKPIPETSQSSDTSTEEQLLADYRTFVGGASKTTKLDPIELTRLGLRLLKLLPAVKDRVLDYLCSIFDSTVEKYFVQRNSETASSGAVTKDEDDLILKEVHSVLCGFVKENPVAWAPVISKWSLALLGELSSKYSSSTSVAMAAGLNETLQLWMSCHAAHTLIDITTQCMNSIMHSETEACIDALLDTSVQHSPHFDWVVAHVGICFPHTVITRVLSCGLKDFSQHGPANQAAKAPKLNSVVGILGHLAGSHFANIQVALLELFKWGLKSDEDFKEQRDAAVPFLLQLSSLSPTLLRALTSDVSTVTPDLLPRLAELAPLWCPYFGGAKPLLDLVVHLALGCEQGGAQIILLLLDAANQEDGISEGSPQVQRVSKEILDLLLHEIRSMLWNSHSYNIALLGSLKKDISKIQPLLMKDDILQMDTAVHIMELLGYESPSVVVNAVAYILEYATTADQLIVLLRLVTGELSRMILSTADQEPRSLLCQAVEQVLLLRNRFGAPPHRFVKNLGLLMKWERSGRAFCLQGHMVREAVGINMEQLVDVLDSTSDTDVASCIAMMLNRALLLPDSRPQTQSVRLHLKLGKALVKYFFLAVSEGESMVGSELLMRLCVQSAESRTLVTRELLETALFHPVKAVLFGAKPAVEPERESEVCLLEENHKQGSSAMLAQRHSSVFHAGVIGFGPRRQTPDNTIPSDDLISNTQQLVSIIKTCCATSLTDQHVSLDAMTSIALLLVELISPDIMYNGLPWPDEEFCKVTVERDLHVRRVLDEIPLCWILLTLVAMNRPALCFCSVLLRAVAATVLAQWSSAGRSADVPGLVDTTLRMLDILTLGQLLPPPLSCIRDVVPYVEPHQVVVLLRECMWAYLQETVPTPAHFSRTDDGQMWRDPSLSVPGPRFTDPLCNIMASNLSRFGQLYAQLFVRKPNP